MAEPAEALPPVVYVDFNDRDRNGHVRARMRPELAAELTVGAAVRLCDPVDDLWARAVVSRLDPPAHFAAFAVDWDSVRDAPPASLSPRGPDAYTGRRPGYQDIINDLTRLIRSGGLPPGAQIPSTAQLGEQYVVSHTTVRAAISRLQQAGLLIGQRGKGVYVPDPVPQPHQAAADDDIDQLRWELAEVRAELAALTERLARLQDPQ